MKTIALTGLNTPVDGGARRDRSGWLRWAHRQTTADDRRLGFTPVASLHHSAERGDYFRISWGAMPAIAGRSFPRQ